MRLASAPHQQRGNLCRQDGELVRLAKEINGGLGKSGDAEFDPAIAEIIGKTLYFGLAGLSEGVDNRDRPDQRDQIIGDGGKQGVDARHRAPHGRVAPLTAPERIRN